VDFDYLLPDLKWSAWVPGGTPLPTDFDDAISDYDPVGAYEGARYLATGIYRPAPGCMMRSLAYDYCAVCREAIVLGIWSEVDPIDTAVPAAASLDLEEPETFAVEVIPVGSPGGPLAAEWRLDGVPRTGDGTTLVLRPTDCGAGTHALEVRITDTTAWIRNDPEAVHTTTHTWSLTVGGAASDAAVPVDAAPDAATGGDASLPADGGTNPPPGGGGCGCAAGEGGAGAGGWVVLLLLGLWWLRRARAAKKPHAR
jgi:MYXO-CTERM domain-containing protein